MAPVLFLTLAVAAIVMVTGAGPHANRMIPPLATALTTAADVQLAAVPSPITRVGCVVSTGPASAGIAALPPGFPAFFKGVLGEGAGPGARRCSAAGTGPAGDGPADGVEPAATRRSGPHPATARRVAISTTVNVTRTRGMLAAAYDVLVERTFAGP